MVSTEFFKKKSLWLNGRKPPRFMIPDVNITCLAVKKIFLIHIQQSIESVESKISKLYSRVLSELEKLCIEYKVKVRDTW